MPITGLSDPVWSAIRERIASQWIYTSIQWPNEKWQNVPDVPFLKVEFDGNVYGQVSIGAETQSANRWDRDGTVSLFLMAPLEWDINEVYGASLELAKIFRGYVALNGDLEFLDATVASNPFNNDVGGWFVVPVTIDWRAVNQ